MRACKCTAPGTSPATGQTGRGLPGALPLRPRTGRVCALMRAVMHLRVPPRPQGHVRRTSCCSTCETQSRVARAPEPRRPSARCGWLSWPRPAYRTARTSPNRLCCATLPWSRPILWGDANPPSPRCPRTPARDRLLGGNCLSSAPHPSHGDETAWHQAPRATPRPALAPARSRHLPWAPLPRLSPPPREVARRRELPRRLPARRAGRPQPPCRPRTPPRSLT